MSADAPDLSKEESDSTQSAEDSQTFEQALARLESIVDRLEEGDLELESALADFEEGVKLTRRCAGELSRAERRIEVLVREGEKWVSRPFESVVDGDEEDTEGEAD